MALFGNPLISNTPVDDIYRSQADTYGNSFGNPMNPANQNQGWDIDPSLLSPSYMAPYRPNYKGPNGANEYGHTGFFNGIAQLSPFSRDTNWGNPIMHQQQAIEDVSNRPMDATMWGFQRIAMPIAAFSGANRLLKSMNLGWKSGAKFGSGFGNGLASSFGANGAGIRATGAGIRGAYQAEGMMGAARAMGGIGFGGAANFAARGTMGAAFGLAAGVGLPLALGQAGITVGEKGLIDPYINTRATARDLRSNFSGITFGDMGGNAVTGKGLSFSESTNMAQRITDQGISDMSFSNDEYRKGADMIGRTGLLDNSNGSQITQRIKENMKQVKLIMSIANMPEMKDAVEQLAKLQMAGASTKGDLFSTASQTMGNMGRFAAMAGTTTQRLMNTTGAQGQYLYQANGMTPYLGQMAAGASYSALSAAQRMGVLSTEQMARMGGLDGATQASLTGQINSSQTLYNKMAMYNSFIGGSSGTQAGYGRNQSAIGVVQKFGQQMANDPLGVYGGMMMFGRQMAGKQMEERGSLAVEDQVMSRVPEWLLDKNGKLSAERAVPFMMQNGMNEDQIQAFFANRMAETDPETYNARRKAMTANSSERIRQYISDTGTYGGGIGGGIYSARKFGREYVKTSKALFIDPITNFTGKAGDAIQKMTDSAWFGTSIDNPNDNIDDLLGKSRARKQTNVFDVSDGVDFFAVTDKSKASKRRHGVAEDINDLITSRGAGSDLASDYMGDTNVASRRKKLEKLINSGNLRNTRINDYTSDYKSTDEFIALDNSLIGRKRKVYKEAGGGDVTYDAMGNVTGRVGAEDQVEQVKSGFDKELEKVSGAKVADQFNSLQNIGDAIGIATDKNLTPGTADEAMETNAALQKFAKSRGIKSGAEAFGLARKIAIRARSTGIDEFATVASTLNDKDYASHDAALRDAYGITGGAHKNAMPNAGNLTEDEALGVSSEVRQNGLQDVQLNKLLKEGRIDMNTYKQSMSQIDNGKAVKEFQRAVDQFSKSVKEDSKNPASDIKNSPASRIIDYARQKLSGGN